ncbi:uncharacterized protein BP5553_01111 [Venustampulla echinocandica]|uniref:Uncharacterized protein n=1 Tax=Venustampulla echinocandica TaxID=2656787 RepID=A0A370U025_9HELO|nr:uncharacterized protein BP5553_01111 [Venustampulla echinocandica]RDL41132.1 hypothetical protein BP5553_01111 [Venustampulla echinocandica]
MATITSSFTKKDSLPVQSRPPLLPRVLSPSSTAHKQVRRKTSFVLWSNSSDDPPSPHNSIYDAQYLSANNSEEGNNGSESFNLPIYKPLNNSPRNKNNAKGGESSIPCHSISETSARNHQNSRAAEPYMIDTSATDTQFLYGHGTLLKTITEQNSCATMNSLARRKSVDDLPNPLNHRDSFVLAKSLRRRHSFSLDDLALIKPSYYDGCPAIESTTLKLLPIHEIYAQPKFPLHAPLPRPQTPPGMPSWTQAQNLPARRHLVNPQPNRLQRFFSLSASGFLLSSHASRTDPPTANRAVSAPVGRRAPRFRPTRSAYAPIDQHPFNHAPVANICNPNASPSTSRLTNTSGTNAGRRFGRRVRFTASATARDSEMNSLRNAIESTSSVAINPMAAMQVTRRSQHISTEPGCPHRKGRQAALKTLRSSLNHRHTASPNNEYTVARVSVSPSRQNSPASSVRILPRPLSNPASVISRSPTTDPVFGIPERSNSLVLSVSSAAHLMSGALQETMTEPKSKPTLCWKCWVEMGFEKMDQWWLKSASCLCFVCCGFDIEGDMRLRCGPRSSSGANFCPSPRTSTTDMLGPRRVVLNASAAI